MSTGNTPLPYTGLTKRELFAAMAMRGILSCAPWSDKQHDLEYVSAAATKYADALITELNKEK